MGKRWLGLLVTAVLGLLAVLWLAVVSPNRSRATSRAATGTKAPPAPAAPPPSAATRAPAQPAPAPQAPAAEPPAPGSDEDFTTPHGRELLLAGEVPQHLLQEVARCYHNEPGDDQQRMVVAYVLDIKNGAARISEARVERSELQSMPNVERCVIDTLTGHSWKQPGAPDLHENLDLTVSILGLRKRNQEFAGQPDPDDAAD